MECGLAHQYTVHYLCLDGVIGVCVGDEVREESNFHISQVLMKVKLHDSEAGWIVRISEVTEDEQEV